MAVTRNLTDGAQPATFPQLPSRTHVAPIRASQIYLRSSHVLSSPSLEALIFAPYGRTDVAAVPLMLPIAWDEDPYGDRNWRAQLQMWRMLDPYFKKFENSGDALWLEVPLQVVLDWHRFHCVEGRKTTYSWSDMMAGIRAMKLAFLVSHWQHGNLKMSSRQTDAMRELVDQHLAVLLDKASIKLSNHALADLHGAAALAQVVSPQVAKTINQFIDEFLPRCIRAQFDDRGVHLEHSPAYHPFGIECLIRLEQSGWFGKHRLGEIARTAKRVSEWFHLPDGRFAPVGDTTGAPPRRQEDTVFSGRRQAFNSSGYAIIRDDGGGKVANASYFFLMGAYHSPFHKHEDDLSIIWFEGEDILCDAGKYAYKNDRVQEYVISSAAHNTIEIDGRNFRHRRHSAELPYGSAIEVLAVHGWGFLVSAQAHHRLSGVHHVRHCLYQPGEWLLIVDKVVSNDSHTVTQWFHFSPDLVLIEGTADKVAKLKSSGKILSMRHAGSASRLIRERGVTQPRLQGWISRTYAEIEPNLALGYTQTGSTLLFATLFALDERKSSLELSSGNLLRVAVHTVHARENLELTLDGADCSVRELIRS